MFKFVHTADWQLGAPNQPLDCQKPLEALISATKAADCKFIICAGDIFHRHSPDQQTKDYLLQTILDNQDIFFAFMAGNHDYTNKEMDYTSLRYLTMLAKAKKITNAWVLEPGKYISSSEVIIWALANWADLQKNVPFDRGDQYLVAMWHGIIPGFNIKNGVYDSNEKKYCYKGIQKNNINYVALGDIHKQFQINDKCYYSGALTQTSYVDDLGALLVTIDEEKTSVKSLSLAIPKKVSFSVEYSEEKNTEEDIVSFVKDYAKADNFVKLKFNLPVEAYTAINKTYVADQCKQHCLSVIFENDPVVVTRTRKNMEKMQKATTFEQEIEVIIETEDFELDKDEIRKKVLEIIIHSEME